MIITTSQVAVLGSLTTLLGVFGTMLFEERRFKQQRKAKWHGELKNTYVQFLVLAKKIHDTLTKLADELIKSRARSSASKGFQEYSKLVASANDLTIEIKLIGSLRTQEAITVMIGAENQILSFADDYIKKKKTGVTFEKKVTKAKKSYNDAYREVIDAVRQEFELE